MTEQKDSKDLENKIMKEEVDKAVVKLLPKLIEHIFAASEPKTNMPPNDEDQEEIPIYERLAPGEMLIISRSKQGLLVVANCEGECDVGYYSECKE
jgi:hypothetical protein